MACQNQEIERGHRIGGDDEAGDKLGSSGARSLQPNSKT